MKLFVLFLLFMFCFTFNAKAQNESLQIKSSSEKTPQETLWLKKEDALAQEEYQRTKQTLEKTKLFKTFDDLYKDKQDGLDLTLKTDDKTYFMPMFFAFSSTKHSFGIALESGNILKKGEKTYVSLGTSKENFYSNNEFSLNKNTFYLDFNNLNFNQRFYKDGWSSMPGVFISADDSNKYNENLLGEIKTKKDSFSFSYARKISDLWQFSITPQYQYYFYQGHILDSGKHSNISLTLEYADDIDINISMNALTKVNRRKKEYFLKNLTRVRQGKMFSLSYTGGGTWTGSNYEIQKLSLGGTYLWELKKHHRLALFAKGIKAFKTPFSSQVESSDLLFRLGIYDREQRGKAGGSFGISFDYFVFKNQVGFLSLMPFYEQAYIQTLENNYNQHSGLGAILTYQFWAISMPISFNFTHNLSDSSQHIGVRIGGYF